MNIVYICSFPFFCRHFGHQIDVRTTAKKSSTPMIYINIFLIIFFSEHYFPNNLVVMNTERLKLGQFIVYFFS